MAHEPIQFSYAKPDVDAALRCGIMFVRTCHANFDDELLMRAMQFCECATEREYFMLAVIGELRSLAGGDD